jgi:hypothetical protein
MKPLKAVLIVAGIYAGALLAGFGLLVVGAIAAGSSGASQAETVLLAVLAICALVFALGALLAFFVLGRAGLSVGVRLLAVLAYGLLAAAALIALFFIGALVFNR